MRTYKSCLSSPHSYMFHVCTHSTYVHNHNPLTRASPLTERFGTCNKLTRLSPESARASILFFRYAGILTDDCFLLTATGLSGRAFSELLLLLLIAPLSGLPFSCFASHSSLFCLKNRTKKMMIFNLIVTRSQSSFI